MWFITTSHSSKCFLETDQKYTLLIFTHSISILLLSLLFFSLSLFLTCLSVRVWQLSTSFLRSLFNYRFYPLISLFHQSFTSFLAQFLFIFTWNLSLFFFNGIIATFYLLLLHFYLKCRLLFYFMVFIHLFKVFFLVRNEVINKNFD